MLINIFCVPEDARNDLLREAISSKVAESQSLSITVININFSPVDRRVGRLRILPTGELARRKEQAIIGVIGRTCEVFFIEHGYVWYGFENPSLAGQE